MRKDSMAFRDVPTDDDLTAYDGENGGPRAATRGRAAMHRFAGEQVASSSAAAKDKLRKANENASNDNAAQSTRPSTKKVEKQPITDVRPDPSSIVPPQPEGPSSTVHPPVEPPTGSSSISQSSVEHLVSTVHPPVVQPTSSSTISQAPVGQVVRPVAVNAGAFPQFGNLLSGNVDQLATDPMILMASAVLPHPGWTAPYGQQDQFITAAGTLFLPRWTTECPVWHHPIFFQRMSSRDIVGSMTEIGILLAEKID